MKHIILIIFSLALVAATLFIPTRLENREEIQRTKLGYPAYFMEQNFFDKYGGQYFFPTWEKIDWSGKYPIVSFSPGRLAVDFVLIFLICEGFIYLLETIDFAIRKK
ncbi:MAG: hypothetical protein WC022_04170 [Parcubacteria group bacterium]